MSRFRPQMRVNLSTLVNVRGQSTCRGGSQKTSRVKLLVIFCSICYGDVKANQSTRQYFTSDNILELMGNMNMHSHNHKVHCVLQNPKASHEARLQVQAPLALALVC